MKKQEAKKGREEKKGILKLVLNRTTQRIVNE